MLYFLIILINITNLLLQHRAIFWNRPKRNGKRCTEGSMKTPFSSNSTTQGNLENNRTHSLSTEHKIKSPDSFLNLTRLFQQWKPTWCYGKIPDILLIYFSSSLAKWFHLFQYPEASFHLQTFENKEGGKERSFSSLCGHKSGLI